MKYNRKTKQSESWITNIIRFQLLVFVVAGLLASCAKQGFPSGGPKDTDPPVVKGVSPASQTTNYTANKFRIDFDEYVTIKDADNNVLISPPMATKPEYSTKGHSVIVKIKDTLQSNTTYLFQFKGAIVDFNEGNPLPSFEYVFSTGEALDSMTISGRVIDALTHQPPSTNISVLAYEMATIADTVGDSLIAKQQPTYQTRISSSGEFQLNYLRPGSYKIIAIEDVDRNLKYTATEAIAWLDTTVTSWGMPKSPKQDTIKTEPMDTASLPYVPDSLKEATEAPHQPIELLLSQKATAAQRVLNSTFTSRGCLQVITQSPMENPVVTADSVIWKLSKNRDTILLWTLRQTRDSVYMVLSDSATALNDTLTIKYRETKKSKRLFGKSNQESQEVNKLQSLIGATHPYYDTMSVSFSVPIDRDVLDSLTLMNLGDSTLGYAQAILDSVRTLARIIPYETLKQGEKYKLQIPANICRDLFGRPNDSLVVTTTITKAEDYGMISIDLVNLPSSKGGFLLQLLTDKGDIVRQLPVTAGTLQFINLQPATYRLRLIDDRNGDREWTPGDYYRHEQPEAVYYYTKSLQLRANWEMAETWEVEASAQ